MDLVQSQTQSYSDESLCRLAASGDPLAETELVGRYTRLVRVCARPLFLAGGDSEDLIQEGMLGLLAAIRGFQNEPQRCKACRDARKNAARGPREYFTATCAACGGEARVPFEPKSDRPVYCSECFAKMREQQG